MNYIENIQTKIMNNIDDIAETVADVIIKRFVEALEGESADKQLDDPSHPLHYIEEFREFLIDAVVKESVIKKNGHISIITGDTKRLGFDEYLNEDDTDPIKIIGTVIQGIAGEYVLVLPEQAKAMFREEFNAQEMGRFGGAFIMTTTAYDYGMKRFGWPQAPVWEFSNFPGIPDLFNNTELEKGVSNKVEEVLSR